MIIMVQSKYVGIYLSIYSEILKGKFLPMRNYKNDNACFL